MPRTRGDSLNLIPSALSTAIDTHLRDTGNCGPVCELVRAKKPRKNLVVPRKPLLPHKLFASIVKHAPLIAIDLIVQNESGEVLLGLRRNAPARGFWFVPGGRVLKNERITIALTRIIGEELAIDVAPSLPSLVGLFEHFYDDNFTRAEAFGTHYLVLAHRLTISSAQASLLPRQQHAGYRWVPPDDLAHIREIHPYSREYARHLRNPPT